MQRRFLRVVAISGALVCLLVGFAIAGSAVTADGIETVRMGVLANRGTQACLDQWQPTAQYLQTTIPEYKFEIVPLSFDEIEGAVASGAIDFVLCNPSLYVHLSAQYGVSRIVTLENSVLGEGHTAFGGVLFWRADRVDLVGWRDLAGKRLAAVQETSLGGWQMAWRELQARGFDPYTQLGSLSFTGTQDAVVYAVRDGLVDAGIVRTDTLERMAAERKIDLDTFVVPPDLVFDPDFPLLHSTRLYPEWPLAKLDHANDSLADRVAVSLLRMSANSSAAQSARITGWTVPLNYQPVRELLDELGVTPYKGRGTVTLVEAIKQHAEVFTAVGLCLLVLAASTIGVLRLNSRLQETQQGLMRELVERKRTEEQLHMFRWAVEQSPASVVITDTEGCVTYANKKFEVVTGYTIEEALGQNPRVLKSGEHDRAFYTDLWSSLRAGREWHGEFRNKKKNGELFWESASISPLRNGEGEVTHYVAVKEDITETKHAAALLAQSERRFRHLFDNMSSGVAVYQAQEDGRRFVLKDMNRASERIDNVRRDEILGQDLLSVFPGADAFGLVRILQRVWETGEPEHFPTSFYQGRRVGGWRENYVYRLPSGEIVAIYDDVTKRVHAERALRESEERYRMLVENQGEGVGLVDEQECFLFANPKADEIFGVEQGTLKGRCLTEFCDDANYALIRRETAARQEGHKSSYEMEIIRPSGERRTILLTGTPHLDEAGRVESTLGIFRDITERKEVEARIQESEAKLRAITSAAHDGIIMMDREHVVSFWNAAAAQIFDYAPDEAIGRTLCELVIQPELRQVYQQQLGGICSPMSGAGEATVVELQAMRRDGSQVPVELSLAPIQIGKEWHTVAVARDVTERKCAEKELHRALQVASDANRAKSEFLANMSHEIRTPMNGVLGMLQLALDTSLDGEQREYLDLAQGSAESLLGLLNDILDFSKIEAGRMDLEATSFQLRGIVGDTIKALAPKAHGKGLELACHIPPAVRDGLVGDPMRLRQVLVNLIGNAIKFTENGEVELEITQMEQKAGRARLCFAVRDTGIGIALDKQEMIFDAFRQADNTTTRRYGGTGLGLVISSRLVEMMGGSLRVESELGRGSTFGFCIELGIDDAVPTSQDATTDLDGVRVLVVDDNDTNRLILREMVTHWGMLVGEAPDGSSALRELERAARSGRPYQLVLLDAMMPGMDGFELVTQMGGRQELVGATVMMLSSADGQGDAERCRRLGIAAYLRKPIGQAELEEGVARALGKTLEVTLAGARIARLAGSECSLRILLAEDNLVNQRVAAAMLKKRGHTVEVVGNGREAVQRTREMVYDVVLMDVQMPEMDGFQATRCVREREAVQGGHVPIVAMTAHAMKGDRERCLAAGMDSYVAKPLNAQNMFEIIEQVVDQAAAAPDDNGGLSAEDLFDLEGALGALGADEEFIKGIAELFLQESQRLLPEIEAALEAEDGGRMAAAVQGLKRAMGYLKAPDAYHKVLALAKTGESGDLTEAHQQLDSLKKRVHGIRQNLLSYIEM